MSRDGAAMCPYPLLRGRSLNNVHQSNVANSAGRPVCPDVPLAVGETQWQLLILFGWQRMVLMHDAPPAVDLAQTQGQSKFERFPLTV